jgi:NAD(P)-dependent dehydrogenase (short-subunit alcohol dehydrogenase family)
MANRTVLITGANKSIGFETARQLGSAGYRVWLGARDLARGEDAASKLAIEGLDVRFVQINVADDGSVLKAAQRISAEDGKLDLLINNAGIAGDIMSSPLEQSVQDVKDVFETNVFGIIRVTQAFVPLLRKGDRAGVINISSGLGSLSWLSDPSMEFYGFNVLGYNTSKSAVNALTVSFSKALSVDGISVNAADPGYTATDFNNHTGYRSVSEAASGITWLAEQSARGLSGGYYFGETRVPW